MGRKRLWDFPPEFGSADPWSGHEGMRAFWDDRNQALRSTQSILKMQGRCQHGQAVASATAGMGRFLCESCGHVSIKLVNEALTRPGIRKPRGAL